MVANLCTRPQLWYWLNGKMVLEERHTLQLQASYKHVPNTTKLTSGSFFKSNLCLPFISTPVTGQIKSAAPLADAPEAVRLEVSSNSLTSLIDSICL